MFYLLQFGRIIKIPLICRPSVSTLPARTKYYRISQAYVRWCTDAGLVKTEYLASEEHPCDVLNKFVSKIKLKKFLPAILGPQNVHLPADAAAVVNLARWKQCARREPRGRRLMGSEFASRSNSDPQLVCRCNVCKCWFPWIPSRQKWISCRERGVNCENHSNCTVTCFACKGPTRYNRRLESYSCPTRRLSWKFLWTKDF